MSIGSSANTTEKSELQQTDERILVVDDEPAITELVSTALRFVGFDVQTAASGLEALSVVDAFRPDLVVLDVMMPGMDGFGVCGNLREHGNQTPVIFLTARDDQDDKLRGFTRGGDDYITKPFSLEELVARIRAVLRRTGIEQPSTTRHRYADLELDEDAHRVSRKGQPVQLSPTEFRLLRYLLLNRERVVSKLQILDHVWQYDYQGEANVVETYISYLRKKIDRVDPQLIHTVRGVGYTLRLEPG